MERWVKLLILVIGVMTVMVGVLALYTTPKDKFYAWGKETFVKSAKPIIWEGEELKTGVYGVVGDLSNPGVYEATRVVAYVVGKETPKNPPIPANENVKYFQVMFLDRWGLPHTYNAIVGYEPVDDKPAGISFAFLNKQSYTVEPVSQVFSQLEVGKGIVGGMLTKVGDPTSKQVSAGQAQKLEQLVKALQGKSVYPGSIDLYLWLIQVEM